MQSSSDYFEVHSPTDSSEDSVEVKITPISSLSSRVKRKLPTTPVTTAATNKTTTEFLGPLKKRVCLKVRAEREPFRPWSSSSPPPIIQSGPGPGLGSRPGSIPDQEPEQEEPVALVKRRDSSEMPPPPRVPIHPQPLSSIFEKERLILNSVRDFPVLAQSSSSSTSSSVTTTTSSSISSTVQNHHHQQQQQQNHHQQRREQRNYKNMTRERRIEANARERTRVHTISAAFDTLRKAIPSYSHNQKLSKLSVLRIACSYIMTLSSIVNNCVDDHNDGDDVDNDNDGSDVNEFCVRSTADCVDLVTKTIQREGKLRKKKDDND